MVATKPLVVIAGPTASGKSSLALELARTFSGELVCADSRTIYRHMDIGTAKPPADEQKLVPHHLLDILEPDQPYSAAEFKAAAEKVIADIHGRGKLPIMVGGTGLYIDALVFNYGFGEKADPAEREKLNRLSTDQLQALLLQKSIPFPANPKNPRHLIRQIETGGATHTRKPRPDTLYLGVAVEKDLLYQRIEARVDLMFREGLWQEVNRLRRQYSWDAPGLRAIGYQEFREHFDGSASLDEVKQRIIRNTQLYAKRQLTWFRRNKSIQWLHNPSKSVDIITTFLNKSA